MATFRDDYAERVYAGVLGKIIGVYLGRPFEQWPYDRIQETFGDIEYYVHEKVGQPLIVTDDDISGTFTFVRALEDHGCDPALTAEQIGRTWLNYVVETRTILWWGGMGQSSEHTAYLRLKSGVPAPRSGSVELNGPTIGNQIGAQIFSDGWGLVNPGDPERAAHFARLAGSVSHDDEALHGAVVVAAMVAAGFEESNVDRLTDIALQQLPADCKIREVIDDVREIRSKIDDWKEARLKLLEKWSYELWPGGCHMLPNHMVIQLALQYGDGDFSRSMSIVNTAAYDTDCNSGNVGCILATAQGLAAFEGGPDWRGPVADRMLIPTADGGNCMTDAVRQADRLVAMAKRLAGEPTAESKPRFHFGYKGSVQGFTLDDGPECRDVGRIVPSEGHLRIDFHHLAKGRLLRATTPIFPDAKTRGMGGYSVFASPALSPGQTIHARLKCDTDVEARLVARVLRSNSEGDWEASEWGALDGETMLIWTLPSGDFIVESVGVELRATGGKSGTLRLLELDWQGAPNVDFRDWGGSRTNRHQWIFASDDSWVRPFRVVANEALRMEITGCREWTDYRVSCDAKATLAERFGLLARVQGQRRWVGVLVGPDQKLRLVECVHDETVLAESELDWAYERNIPISIRCEGDSIVAEAGGVRLEGKTGLTGGGIGLACELGRADFQTVNVRPL